MYSKLFFVRGIDANREVFDEIIKTWKEGIKIYFFTDKEDVVKNLKKYIEENLGYLNNYNEFKFLRYNLFNIGLYSYGIDINENFSIVDGKESICYEKVLREFDKNTDFNLQQYKMEHESIDSDILCVSKAGTGKTYSMISRINFLIEKMNYDIPKIKKKICIITFTNEATFVMKNRLKTYYRCLYILTKNLKYLEIIEEIEKMQISTIHNVLKRIIDKLAIKIGVGFESSIYSGRDEINKIISNQINKYYIENNEIYNKHYNFEKAIKEILGKLEEKNIRIKDGFDLGRGKDINSRVINSVIGKVQEEVIENSKYINKVRLKEHVMFVLEALKNYGNETKKEFDIDYLFIDEFQDTDDMQIRVLNEMRKLLDFRTFIVGDVMQSIYRFRGANHTAFNQIEEENFRFKKYTLVKNYRTDEKLLKYINSIFNTQEYVNYNCEIKGTKVYEHAEFIKRNNLVKIVKELSRKKETTAILVRCNRECIEVKESLEKNGIYIKSTADRNLYKEKSTIDFYKLILALKFNKDPKYIFNLINTNYVTKAIDMGYIYSIRDSKEKKVEYFKSLNLVDGFYEYVEKLRKEPVLKVLRDIKEKTKPWSVEEDNREYKYNLDQLFEVIIDKFNGEYLTLNKICKFLEIAITKEMSENVKGEYEKPEIICSTIHKVKGLEFDNIILPFSDNDIKVDSKEMRVIVENNKIGYKYNGRYLSAQNTIYEELSEKEDGEEIAEEVRILYVALTRAKKGIYYIDGDKGKLTWGKIIRNGIVRRYENNRI